MVDSRVINEIEKTVRRAGGMLLSAQLTKDEIFQKEGPANFVTIYDRQIQQVLIQNLKTIIPDASFYGEEDTAGNEHGDINKGYVFFVDPIDGTTNFLFDYNHSCISVGLSFEGIMVAGFVFDPYHDRMYKGINGLGAYLNDRKLVLENKPLSEGLAEFGCARYNDDRIDYVMDIVKELFLRSISIRCGGSAALGISMAATGSNVLYYEYMLQPYDYAAAGCIIEQAGGVICQPNGDDITLSRGCSIVAGTRNAVEEFMTIANSSL